MNTQVEGYRLSFDFVDKHSRDEFLTAVTLRSHPCHFIVECINNTRLEIVLCDGYGRVFDFEKKRLDELYKKVVS